MSYLDDDGTLVFTLERTTCEMLEATAHYVTDNGFVDPAELVGHLRDLIHIARTALRDLGEKD